MLRGKCRQFRIGDESFEDESVDGRTRGARRRVCDDFARANDRKAWTEGRHIVDDVRREKHHAARAHLSKQSVEALTLFWVEARGRLVDDENARIPSDRLREAKALPHTAGVPTNLALCSAREIHALEQFIGKSASAVRSRDTFQLQQELQHRAAREIGIKAEVLREIPKALAHVPRMLDDVDAVEEHLARGRLDEPRDDVHEGRLPRAIRPKQAEHAFGDLKIDAAQRADGARVNLDQSANGEWSVLHGCCLWFTSSRCAR